MTAPMVLDGAMHGAAFLAYVDQVLVPTLERHRTAAVGIEHHHPDRRGVDQGLQVGPGPLLGPVRAGVGDRRRRLRGEQHQDLLVLARELLPARLLAEKEVADMHPPPRCRIGVACRVFDSVSSSE